MEKYKQILEGLLFLSGDEGLCMTQLLGVFQDELTQETLEILLDEMMKEYMEQARGFELVCYGGVYKLVSKAIVHPYAEKLFSKIHVATLSELRCRKAASNR